MQEVLNDKDTNSEQTMNRNCSIKGSPISKSTRQITVLKSWRRPWRYCCYKC